MVILFELVKSFLWHISLMWFYCHNIALFSEVHWTWRVSDYEMTIIWRVMWRLFDGKNPLPHMADNDETDILSLSRILNEYCKDLKLILLSMFILTLPTWGIMRTETYIFSIRKETRLLYEISRNKRQRMLFEENWRTLIISNKGKEYKKMNLSFVTCY